MRKLQGHDPYTALRSRDYRLYMVGNVLSILGVLAQETAIGWELYERTGSALALGLVGLVQVAPIFLLTFPAGHVADRFDRRRVLMASQVAMAMAALVLAWLSWTNGPVLWIYFTLFAIGVTRAFLSPASAALLPQIVPEEHFENAVTWQSTGFQIAAVAGPALGGILIGIRHSATEVFLLSSVTALIFLGCAAGIRGRRAPFQPERPNWKSLVAGLQFVMKTKIILATITMDMFAVLLGGATTLLPIFAKTILHVGPSGYGWLRAAPAAGAFVMAVGIAHLPPMRRAGPTLLWAVAGFGAATIVFGISKSFMLSMAMLFLLGGLDSISVIVRSALVQIRTPDALRGRVSAVNSLFVGTSNELGGFESGLVASWIGPVSSVVLGGIGTILVVLGIAYIWPEVRKLGPLREAEETPTGP
jgi:MFS family permease